MRVIGGEFRGRRLVAPGAPSVRPTSDRVREAVFDILFSLGGVEGTQVLDLFAGSGAMGIEALSRGASSVTLVERDPDAVAVIRQNLASVGAADAERDGTVTVIRADVDRWVATTASRYDLVLCDPPYAYDGWSALVPRLPGDLAVLESGVDLVSEEGWGVVKTRRYGSTLVTVVQPDQPDRVPPKGAL
jgi:16S rRNA (guanine966-N2)-methyltransferase